MIVAAGNINEPYEVIGMVHACVSRRPGKAGCGGSPGLPVQEAYDAALATLRDSAKRSGANGLIHVTYDYRVTTAAVGCGSNSESVFEVYGWGTAIRIG